MAYIYDAFLYVALFVILKAGQMVASFVYTTYKSLTIHKSWAHAFHPGLRDRLHYGLKGDIFYFAAGVFIALSADKIRALI
jgi:hypothetical protein